MRTVTELNSLQIRRHELPFVRHRQDDQGVSEPQEKFVASGATTPVEVIPEVGVSTTERMGSKPEPAPAAPPQEKSPAEGLQPGVELVEGAHGVLATLEEGHHEGHGHEHINHGRVNVGLGGSLAGKHVEHAVKHVEHAAEYASHASELGAEGGMTVSDATEVLADARHVVRDGIVEKHPEISTHGAEHADKVGWLSWAAPAATLASAVLAPVLVSMGLKELREGVKHNDMDRKLEGAGAITVGVRSGVSALVTGKASLKAFGLSKWIPDLGPVAGPIVGTATKFALKGLGVAHGAIDMALGVRNICRGKIVKGGIEAAFGATLVAASVGLIGVAAPAVLLVAKVGHAVIERKLEARKAQAEQAAEVEKKKLSEPPPAAQSSSSSSAVSSGSQAMMSSLAEPMNEPPCSSA